MEQTVSQQLAHCIKVYEAMDADAADVVDEDSGLSQRIWTGHTTHLVREAGLPAPYYTSIFNALKEMDCIRQIRRGGGPSHSEWALIQPPTQELFVGREPRRPEKTVTARQVLELADRIARIEKALGIV